MKKLLIAIVLLMIAPVAANATCYVGCDYLELLKGDKGDKGDRGPAGPRGPAGADGLSIIGPQGPAGPRGPAGADGLSITGDRGPAGPRGLTGADGRAGMSGLSLTAAISSFQGSGIGAGVSGGGGQLEFSVGAGFELRPDARFVVGITHDKWSRTRGTAGVGFSF